MKTTHRFRTFIQTSLCIVAIIAIVATGSAQQKFTHGKPDSPPQLQKQHQLRPGLYQSTMLVRNHHPNRPGYRSPAAKTNTTHLDSTFGTNGIVATNFGNSAEARSMAIQSDGKIVAAGASGDDFTLVRYDTLGVPDGTFGSGGKVTTDFGRDEEARSVAIQHDGKIVVAGYSMDEGGSSVFATARHDAARNLDATDRGPTVFALARYDTAGNLDTTFGTGGKDTTAIGVGGVDEAYSVAIQSDGKILVAGYSCNETATDFALVRYTANGSLDPTFGTGGKVATAIGSQNDKAYSLAIQSDGKIVVAGYSYDTTTNHNVFALVRYDTSGNLDNTFGTGGKDTTRFGTSNAEAYSVVIQTDGKIVAAGTSESDETEDDVFTVVRYNTDGSLDGTFGSGGKTTIPVGTDKSKAYSIAIQSDRRIVLSGYARIQSDEEFALARITDAGILDSTFGENGTVTTYMGSSDPAAYAVGIQRDGKIVAAGYSLDDNASFALARYIVYPVGFGPMSASHIGDTSATLNGAVNPEGVSTIVWFLYGASSGANTDSLAADQSPITANSGISVSAAVGGLAPGRTYYFTISTNSSKGYFRSDEKSFRTLYPKAGTALKFDGAGDYLRIEDDSRLELTTHYTIEAWIKPHGFAWLGGIVSKYNTSGSRGYVLRLSNASPYTGINFDELQTGSGILEADKWYHIAAVNDSGSRLLYVNGVKVPLSGSSPIDAYANSDPLTIGVDFLAGPRYFNGIIDEVRIYNVALDSTRIRDDMHRVFASTPAGLVGYWLFNDSTGTTAQEVVNGFEGTLTNFNFDASDGWVSSTIPAGKGASTDSTNFTDGTATLGTVSLVTTDGFDAPMQLVATQIDDSPSSLPTSSPTMLSDRYWVVNAFGSPGTFSTSLTFTVPSSFTNNGSESSSTFTLYRRSSASDGDWTMLIHGASGVTSTTVTFDGITSFSQFSLGQGGLLPIQLASLTATTLTTGVQLEWTTLSEVNSLGFYVERRPVNAGTYATVSDLIPGAGTSVQELHYQWMDTKVTDGNYNYRLRLVDLDGSYEYSNAIVVAVSGVLGVGDKGLLPTEFALGQNYPNPFNPSTVINYQLPVASYVKLIVYNMLGQEVATLINGIQDAGYKSLLFDASSAGSGLPSGIYVYKLNAGTFVDVKKMLIVR